MCIFLNFKGFLNREVGNEEVGMSMVFGEKKGPK